MNDALGELLRQPATQTVARLQAEAFELQNQVRALNDEDLDQLRARLAAWWPSVPFKDLVTVDGKRLWMTGPARAWVFLAPAADVPVTDDQWTQLANGISAPAPGTAKSSILGLASLLAN